MPHLWHRWRSFGGETVRDGKGKVLVQWQVCMHRGCKAMRPRAAWVMPPPHG